MSDDINLLIDRCSTDYDLISLTDWSEKPPTIFINYDLYTTKNSHCYDGNSLRKWLDQFDSVFANWEETPGRKLDDMGVGGGPGSERYYKMYTGEHIKDNKYLQEIREDKIRSKYFIYEASYIGEKRIGNVLGIFGESMLHGQAPGYPVYEIFSKTAISGRSEKIELELEKKRQHLLYTESLLKEKEESIRKMKEQFEEERKIQEDAIFEWEEEEEYLEEYSDGEEEEEEEEGDEGEEE